MPVVTISQDCQVAIPPEIRESLGIKPGDKMQVFQHSGRIEIVPVKDVKTLRGIAENPAHPFERDDDRV